MSRKRSSKAPSSRQLRVGEQLRQCLSEVLMEGGLKDPRLSEASMITVTEVRMAPDLRSGVALVSVFPEEAAVIKAVLEGLASAEASIKREVADRLRLRFTPHLRFLLDDSIQQGAKIDQLLAEIAAEAGEGEPEAGTDFEEG